MSKNVKATVVKTLAMFKAEVTKIEAQFAKAKKSLDGLHRANLALIVSEMFEEHFTTQAIMEVVNRNKGEVGKLRTSGDTARKATATREKQLLIARDLLDKIGQGTTLAEIQKITKLDKKDLNKVLTDTGIGVKESRPPKDSGTWDSALLNALKTATTKANKADAIAELEAILTDHLKKLSDGDVE